MSSDPTDTQPNSHAAMRPESPCTKVCKLDATQNYCTGCLRTRTEIGEWSGASAARQWEIVRRVQERSQNKLYPNEKP